MAKWGFARWPGQDVYGSKNTISLFEAAGQLDVDFCWQQDVKGATEI